MIAKCDAFERRDRDRKIYRARERRTSRKDIHTYRHIILMKICCFIIESVQLYKTIRYGWLACISTREMGHNYFHPISRESLGSFRTLGTHLEICKVFQKEFFNEKILGRMP
jgi:hypothetical protein